MDGDFALNMTISFLITETIRPATNLPLDVHLMIDNPDIHKCFAKPGADIISIDAEAAPHLHGTIQTIEG